MSTMSKSDLLGKSTPDIMALASSGQLDPATMLLAMGIIADRSKAPVSGQKLRIQVSRKDGRVSIGITGPPQPGAPEVWNDKTKTMKAPGIGIWTDVHNLRGMKALLTGPALWQTVDSILAETPEQRQAAQIIADAKRAKAALVKASKASKTDETPDDAGDETVHVPEQSITVPAVSGF